MKHLRIISFVVCMILTPTHVIWAKVTQHDILWTSAISAFNNAATSISPIRAESLYKESLALFETLFNTCKLTDQGKIETLTYIINCKKKLAINYYNTNYPHTSIVKDLNHLLSLPQDSATYIKSLLLCSSTCTHFNDIVQAYKFYDEAKRIQLKDRVDDKDVGILFLETLGLLEYTNCREYKGVRHIADATKASKEHFGQYSTEHLLRLLDLSHKYASIGRYHKSRRCHIKAHKPYIEYVRKQFVQASGSKRAEYWTGAYRYFSKTNEIAYQFAQNSINRNYISSTAYDCNLLSKSILLTTSKDFEDYVIHQSDSTISALSRKKSYLPKECADSIDLLIIKRLEQLGLEYDTPHLDITWKDVREHLNSDDLAIEFFKTGPLYGALLIKKHWRYPKCVALGRIPFIPNTPETSILQRRELADMIWSDKILRHFPRREDAVVYFSPAADMYLYGIEYLPLFPESSSSTFNSISDYFNLVRLTSTREIVLHKEHTHKFESAALYGAADFTIPIKKIQAVSNNLNINPQVLRDKDYEERLLSRNLTHHAISPLPNTLLEINQIESHMLSDSLFPIVATGKYFNETIFRRTCANKDLLHIATHGFNLPASNSTSFTSTDPMDRNGFIVSGGAATIWFTHDFNHQDGLLTANEIASLDLNDTRLVVLSVCESGSGLLDIDGVFGLQRGVKKAGAGAIIMSLWKVDDEACQLLFDSFYKELILNHKPTRAAFISAQRTLREDSRFMSPKHWAAFVLID